MIKDIKLNNRSPGEGPTGEYLKYRKRTKI